MEKEGIPEEHIETILELEGKKLVTNKDTKVHSKQHHLTLVLRKESDDWEEMPEYRLITLYWDRRKGDGESECLGHECVLRSLHGIY